MVSDLSLQVSRYKATIEHSSALLKAAALLLSRSQVRSEAWFASQLVNKARGSLDARYLTDTLNSQNPDCCYVLLVGTLTPAEDEALQQAVGAASVHQTHTKHVVRIDPASEIVLPENREVRVAVVGTQATALEAVTLTAMALMSGAPVMILGTTETHGLGELTAATMDEAAPMITLLMSDE